MNKDTQNININIKSEKYLVLKSSNTYFIFHMKCTQAFFLKSAATTNLNDDRGKTDPSFTMGRTPCKYGHKKRKEKPIDIGIGWITWEKEEEEYCIEGGEAKFPYKKAYYVHTCGKEEARRDDVHALPPRGPKDDWLNEKWEIIDNKNTFLGSITCKL